MEEEYIYQIRSFLPIEFEEEETNEFVLYLSSAYLENNSNKKYQFSFAAFHMLYMSFIYKTIWFLKARKHPDILAFVFTKKNINSLFDLSLFGETESIETVFKNFKFHKNDLDKCANPVKSRNHCLHASGKIEYDEKGIDYLISDELKYAQRLQKKLKIELEKLFEDFLEESWGKNYIGGDIKNWIIKNHLSQKDIEQICDLDLPSLTIKSTSKKIVLKKLLYLTAIYECQNHIITEENVFLKKMPMLMNGMVDEIDIRENAEDDVKLKKTQQIIEDKLLSLILLLSKTESEAAKKILKIY